MWKERVLPYIPNNFRKGSVFFLFSFFIFLWGVCHTFLHNNFFLVLCHFQRIFSLFSLSFKWILFWTHRILIDSFAEYLKQHKKTDKFKLTSYHHFTIFAAVATTIVIFSDDDDHDDNHHHHHMPHHYYLPRVNFLYRRGKKSCNSSNICEDISLIKGHNIPNTHTPVPHHHFHQRVKTSFLISCDDGMYCVLRDVENLEIWLAM